MYNPFYYHFFIISLLSNTVLTPFAGTLPKTQIAHSPPRFRHISKILAFLFNNSIILLSKQEKSKFINKKYFQKIINKTKKELEQVNETNPVNCFSSSRFDTFPCHLVEDTIY